MDVVFEDATPNEININIISVYGTNTPTIATLYPFGPTFLGGSLYNTSDFIISDAARELAGGELWRGAAGGGGRGQGTCKHDCCQLLNITHFVARGCACGTLPDFGAPS